MTLKIDKPCCQDSTPQTPRPKILEDSSVLLHDMKIENSIPNFGKYYVSIALQALGIGVPTFILSNNSNPKNDFGHSKKSTYENCCANR